LPPLSWTARVGRIDDAGRMCLPRTAKGVCKETVDDGSLCELPGCRLVLSKSPQPPTECCFTPRFEVEGRICTFAEATSSARDAGAPTCGPRVERSSSVVTHLDRPETERVQRAVPQACCYVEDGDM
jgi:hypothetical protein